jgi:hypothetical protein
MGTARSRGVRIEKGSVQDEYKHKRIAQTILLGQLVIT